MHRFDARAGAVYAQLLRAAVGVPCAGYFGRTDHSQGHGRKAQNTDLPEDHSRNAFLSTLPRAV
jgi:hypothetical protein